MKKYFKIELRMAEYYVDEIDGEEVLKVEQFYVSDGIISIENGKIEGYASLDYINGQYDGEKLIVNVFDCNISQDIVLETEIDEEDFTFPNEILLDIKDEESQVAYLNVTEKISYNFLELEANIIKVKEISERTY